MITWPISRARHDRSRFIGLSRALADDRQLLPGMMMPLRPIRLRIARVSLTIALNVEGAGSFNGNRTVRVDLVELYLQQLAQQRVRCIALVAIGVNLGDQVADLAIDANSAFPAEDIRERLIGWLQEVPLKCSKVYGRCLPARAAGQSTNKGSLLLVGVLPLHGKQSLERRLEANV